MNFSPLMICIGLMSLIPCAAMAQEESPSTDSQAKKEQVLVMALKAAPAVDPSSIKALDNLLVLHLRAVDKLEVVAQADIVAILGADQQRLLVDCDAESCIAEIGGALGAPWMVIGSVDLLGGATLLNLKLLDTREGKIQQQVNRNLGKDAEFWGEEVRQASYSVLSETAPRLDKLWYQRPLVWGITAGVVATAIIGGVVYNAAITADDGTLGRVTF